MKVEIGKKYTCNERAIRILCTDRPGKFPVIGMDEKTGDIHYFKENGENLSYSSQNLVEAWEPQEGEWSWFWDELADCNAHLRRYSRMYSEMGIEFFKSIDGVSWKYCAKFEGELPKHLKDL